MCRFGIIAAQERDLHMALRPLSHMPSDTLVSELARSCISGFHERQLPRHDTLEPLFSQL